VSSGWTNLGRSGYELIGFGKLFSKTLNMEDRQNKRKGGTQGGANQSRHSVFSKREAEKAAIKKQRQA
jgi:hypothetical protein